MVGSLEEKGSTIAPRATPLNQFAIDRMKVKGLVRRDGVTHEGFVRDGATPGLTVQVSWRERDGVRDPKHGIVLAVGFTSTRRRRRARFARWGSARAT